MKAHSNPLPFVIAALALLLSAVAPPLRAQQYTINWSKIAGGGATTPSTGGIYAVSGTIGQHDASGVLTGGVYAVTGGFWPGVTLVQAPDAPLLASELLPGGSVRIYWPLPATGFVLDQTAALASPPASISWSQVAFPYQTNATHIFIIVSPAVGHRAYRLRR